MTSQSPVRDETPSLERQDEIFCCLVRDITHLARGVRMEKLRKDVWVEKMEERSEVSFRPQRSSYKLGSNLT